MVNEQPNGYYGDPAEEEDWEDGTIPWEPENDQHLGNEQGVL